MDWFRTSPRAAIEIDRYVDEHYLDSNGELALKPVQKDMQEYIESSRDTSLQAILDKLSNIGVDSYVNPADDYIADVVGNRSALDLMLEADSVLDGIRQEYGLVGKSRKQVVDFIRGKASATYQQWQAEKSAEANAAVNTEAAKDVETAPAE